MWRRPLNQELVNQYEQSVVNQRNFATYKKHANRLEHELNSGLRVRNDMAKRHAMEKLAYSRSQRAHLLDEITDGDLLAAKQLLDEHWEAIKTQEKTLALLIQAKADAESGARAAGLLVASNYSAIRAKALDELVEIFEDDLRFKDPTLYRWAKVTLGALLNQGQGGEGESLWAIITFLTGGEFDLVLRNDIRFRCPKSGWQVLSREDGPFRVPNKIPAEDAWSHVLTCKGHIKEDRVA